MPRLHPSQYFLAVQEQVGARHTCSQCDALATWHYMPSSERSDRFFCDEHVTRGCSCSAGEIDVNGREMPCIEYDHDEQGYRLPKAKLPSR